jgi:cyanophycinase-like exopeptidase
MSPVRVPEAVQSEVDGAARVLGCNATDLVDRAPRSFRQGPEVVAEFELARKAFSVGDVDVVASRLVAQSTDRARRRASAVQAMRRDDTA